MQAMQAVPKIVPVSDMRNHHKKVMAMLADQPVILAQHSKSAAVLVSISQWDQMAARMQELERYMSTQLRLKDMESGEFYTQDQLDAALKESGL